MNSKKTLVIGASTNPARYSHLAVHALSKNGHEVVALAKREGMIGDVRIETELPFEKDIHTVTLYIGAGRQPEYYDYLLELKPMRVIFNPGTENQELSDLLEKEGIETLQACTLVMLSTGQY